MRILLTGAAGFIGGHIAAVAAQAGHEVIGLDAMLPAAHGSRAPTPAGVVWHDLRVDPVDDLLDGIDVVCHQAAMVGNGVDAQDLPEYAGHNDLATAVLLAAMARRGVGRLVLASSMVVYGDGRYTCSDHGDVPPAPRRDEDLAAGQFDPRCPHCDAAVVWRRIDEDTVFAPRTSYAASKVAQEHLASSWCTQQGGRAIALRYHNVYGPGMPADTPYAGVAALFRSAIERGEPVRVFEDGGQVRDFVHVHDVARANLAALEAVAAHPVGLTAYNVASGQAFTLGEMASVLTAAAGAPSPRVTGQYRSYDVRHVVASAERAERELGFRAAIAPETGLAALATDPLRRRR